jgi:hypothetical protein
MDTPHGDPTATPPPPSEVLAAFDALDGRGRITPSVFTAVEIAAYLDRSTASTERTLERLRRERRVERLDLGPRSRAWKRWAGYREVRSPG